MDYFDIVRNNQAAGMMNGVSGFDPSNPGAYGGNTARDADLVGHGGSPPGNGTSPAAWQQLANSGMAMMAAGAPQQMWQPQAIQGAQPHRPSLDWTQMLASLGQPQGMQPMAMQYGPQPFSIMRGLLF